MILIDMFSDKSQTQQSTYSKISFYEIQDESKLILGDRNHDSGGDR